MKISAFIAVYNEEKRIRFSMESIKWCDEIIVVDKSSTDNTIKICKEYGAKINIIPNSDAYDPSELNYLAQCTGDWIIIMTASDIIDKSLAIEIRHQIETLPENVKCIMLPFRNYILGIEDKRSPWHSSHRCKIFRKGNYKIANDVHGALQLLDNTSYVIPECYGWFSHLTHESADMMMNRHIRYWRGEGFMYDKDSLQPALIDVINSLDMTITQKQTYKLGWDGIAITMAYVSYFMLSFIYKWENFTGHRSVNLYASIRESNFRSWNGGMPQEIMSRTNEENIISSKNSIIKMFNILHYYRKHRIFRILIDSTMIIVKLLDRTIRLLHRDH